MNLTAPIRRALRALLPARSPQQPTEPAAEPARPAAVTPARDWDDPTDPRNRTRWLPVETARARVRDRIDQFPPRPAAPTGPRPRGEASVPEPVEAWEPHNLPVRSRWFP